MQTWIFRRLVPTLLALLIRTQVTFSPKKHWFGFVKRSIDQASNVRVVCGLEADLNFILFCYTHKCKRSQRRPKQCCHGSDVWSPAEKLAKVFGVEIELSESFAGLSCHVYNQGAIKRQGRKMDNLRRRFSRKQASGCGWVTKSPSRTRDTHENLV